ncbi:hypothetical protein J6590_103968 [Homalodisca vitripennis]|nr:hypothetical protein J6590_103968 [Homalodisca vitripennis]
MPARCALLALLEKKLTRARKSRIPDHVMPLLLNAIIQCTQFYMVCIPATRVAILACFTHQPERYVGGNRNCSALYACSFAGRRSLIACF